MNDVGVIDTLFQTFNQSIDSGFGLLRPEVGSLANRLVAIDMTLAALMWTLAGGEDVLARLIRKVLYVGFFAFLIGNFQSLSIIVLTSFERLGLQAAGASLSAEDVLRPGKLAGLGIAVGKPLLVAAGELSGFPGFFENIVQVVVLLVAFLLIVVAFFVMAIQIFVVVVDFKLTTLAGFVLVPFGLFGKTAFLAERVLGGVIAAGIKVLVLALIIGIGSTMFDQFMSTWVGGQPTLEQVLALVLAALTLLGLSIFGPSIASGLVSGAPQLGAGAAVGTGLAVGGMAMAGVAAAQMAMGATAGASMAATGASTGAGRLPPIGGAGPAPGGPGPSSPSPSSPSGGGASASTAAGARSIAGSGGGSQSGAPAAPVGASNDDGASAPQWARELKQRQDMAHGAGLAAHALASGDDHSAGASPSLSE